jgi:Leishmanolysin
MECTVTNGTYNIEVRFLGGLTTAQKEAFTSAAERWGQIISADVPSVTLAGEEIDDVLIFARGSAIDGPSGILGQAGPRQVRPDSFLPAVGMMEFDTADLARMELDGSLENVIFHEMGHVVGLGTIWELKGLLSGAGTINPVFTGESAMREFATLIGADEPTPVPVANTGGPGTRDSHWRETIFANELMTGILNPGPNPVSRITVAAMEDLGYSVSFDAAEDFDLPGFFEVSMMGVGAREHPQGCIMAGYRRRGAKVEVLPESVLA